MQRLMNAARKVAGYKQTMKAVKNGTAKIVYLAKNADEKICKPVLEKCREKGIPIVEIDTMSELGKACGIKVETAAAATLESD